MNLPHRLICVSVRRAELLCSFCFANRRIGHGDTGGICPLRDLK